jgi:hypothetical protein
LWSTKPKAFSASCICTISGPSNLCSGSGPAGAIFHSTWYETGEEIGEGRKQSVQRCSQKSNKTAAYEEILKKAGVPEFAVAFLGDDLPDLPIMRRVGLAVAVGNATVEVKRAAHYVTKATGGKGAARELVELILKSKGIWKQMIDKARA